MGIDYLIKDLSHTRKQHHLFHSLSSTAGVDFHTLIQILEFHSDESLIDVNIVIINDELTESNEIFVVYLNSGAGVKLSPHGQTNVIINDDDGKNVL